jgi:hypothetical protein
MAIYVYGLMRAEDAARAVEAAAGPPLDTVEHEGLSALVRDVGEGSIRLRRESALAHSDTVQAAFEHGPVLPVRFGTVLPDAATLQAELLAPRAAALRGRLEALDGLAEMQVKTTYLEEPLLRSILDGDARLSQSAARIRALPPEATHFERINLGEAIHHEVQVRRQADSGWLVDQLRPLAVAVHVREPRHERAVLNASFLVPRERLKDFDNEVQRLSDQAAERMQFRLIGPMPTHSFAEGSWEGEPVAGSGVWA